MITTINLTEKLKNKIQQNYNLQTINVKCDVYKKADIVKYTNENLVTSEDSATVADWINKMDLVEILDQNGFITLMWVPVEFKGIENEYYEASVYTDKLYGIGLDDNLIKQAWHNYIKDHNLNKLLDDVLQED